MISLYRALAFLRLPPAEASLFLEAFVRLGVSRAGVALLPFRRLIGGDRAPAQSEPPAVDDEALTLADSVGVAIARAARYTPWRSACLAQGLTAQAMLGRRGIGSALYLGANLGEDPAQRLQAHAWVVCGDRVVTGGTERAAYRALACFRQAGPERRRRG